ncbi:MULTISPECIES: helix-turn-helix domain-containing protein [unclassified Streptomyces]|uniref:helix-turn-helix domain-containing protein n=1 Tax=unclassified Streptomyces TaxID=2593676 RepID=UPI002349B721|nr:MerR family transcriptional regulator [Streptomyces sp. M92]WCN03367.1 MerR family transcriptional regulator [Streptomyces sp. M92]
MNDDGTALMTIGELARATGLTVRTIRYWSDEGALPPVARSTGGYRLYDSASVARLELIRTLRELGLGLDAVRRVLAGEETVAQVAAAHVSALDAQIRSLRVTRAVLSTVARRGSTAKETTLMNKLARLSAAERRRIIDDFMAEVFEGIDTADPDIRTRLRFAAANLPDDPTPEQVDAWVELAELIQDPEFRATMRRMIESNAADRGADVPTGSSLWFVSRLVRLAGDALREGVVPDSPQAAGILRALIGDADPAVVRERLTSMTSARLVRYRELSAIVNGVEPPSAYEEQFGWVVAALGARTGS